MQICQDIEDECSLADHTVRLANISTLKKLGFEEEVEEEKGN
jgi:hypothetical protein